MLEHPQPKPSTKLGVSQIFTILAIRMIGNLGSLTKVNKTALLSVKLFAKTCIRCLNMEEPDGLYWLRVILDQPDS